MILFNKNRQKFLSGAVREHSYNKPNPNYIPFDVIDYVFEYVNQLPYPINNDNYTLDNLDVIYYKIHFDKKNRSELLNSLCISVYLLLRYNEKSLYSLMLVMNDGAKKYEPDNWRKGFPIERTLQSLIRHACFYMNDKENAEHLGGYIANCLFIIYELSFRSQELD